MARDWTHISPVNRRHAVKHGHWRESERHCRRNTVSLSGSGSCPSSTVTYGVCGDTWWCSAPLACPNHSPSATKSCSQGLIANLLWSSSKSGIIQSRLLAAPMHLHPDCSPPNTHICVPGLVASVAQQLHEMTTRSPDLAHLHPEGASIP